MSNLNDDNFVYSNITLTNNTGGPYTIGSGTTGTVGPTYTWNTGATSVDWGKNANTQIGSGKMILNGTNADIEVNGRSLMNAIDALEQRLNILVPNPELEKEWDELKELGDRYRELEKQCKEKGEMWAKLKEIKK